MLEREVRFSVHGSSIGAWVGNHGVAVRIGWDIFEDE